MSDQIASLSVVVAEQRTKHHRSKLVAPLRAAADEKRSRSGEVDTLDPQFWRRIEDMGLASQAWVNRSKRIRRLQEKLRHAIDARAWRIYLDLESETNRRVVLLLELLEARQSTRGGVAPEAP